MVLIDKGSTGIKEHYQQATPSQEKEAKLRNDKFPGFATILTKSRLSLKSVI